MNSGGSRSISEESPNPATLQESKVSEFLDSKKNWNTRESYRNALKQFFQCVLSKKLEDNAIALDDASKEYFATGKSAVEYALDYEKFLVQLKNADAAPKTIASYLIVLSSFFTWCEIEIPSVKKKKIRMQLPQYKGALTADKVPSREQLKSIILAMDDFAAQTFVVVMKGAGCRPAELLDVHMKDIDLTLDPPCITFTHTKERQRRFSFVDREGAAYLRQYIFKNSHSDPEARLFPFSYDWIENEWTKAVKKAGLFEKDDNTNRTTMGLYSCRKFFRTYGRDGLDKDILMVLYGHSGSGIEPIYARYGTEQFSKFYKQGMHAFEVGLPITESLVPQTMIQPPPIHVPVSLPVETKTPQTTSPSKVLDMLKTIEAHTSHAPAPIVESLIPMPPQIQPPRVTAPVQAKTSQELEPTRLELMRKFAEERGVSI